MRVEIGFVLVKEIVLEVIILVVFGLGVEFVCEIFVFEGMWGDFCLVLYELFYVYFCIVDDDWY